MTEGLTGRFVYIGQLRDPKISAIMEGFDLAMLEELRETIRLELGAGQPERESRMMSGCTASSEILDEAIGEYANQNARLQAV